MENIPLFALTVIVYYLVWSIVFYEKPVLWMQQVKQTALIALLALPINIGGNVFTIAGNAIAEKNIWSLFSFYQKAGQDAITFIGPAYQQAGRDAVTIFGLANQQAGLDAMTLLGLARQQAEQDAITGIGLAIYQRAGHNATTFIGLAGYQRAEAEAKVPLAIALYQHVGEKTRAFGTFSTLY